MFRNVISWWCFHGWPGIIRVANELFELYNLCASVPENYIACQVGLMLMVIFMSICFHSSDVFALLPLHCVTFQVDASLTLLLLLLLLLLMLLLLLLSLCFLYEFFLNQASPFPAVPCT